jgi:DNA-binding Lrp family transcriptional regulator
VSRGENWSEKTVREIAAETGLSESHTWKQLRQLDEQGKIERRRFRVCTGTTIRPVPHYNFERE